MRKKFLITGVTGFAGPNLVNLLHKEGHQVYCLIRSTNGRENDIRDIISDEVYKDIVFLYSDLKNHRTLQNIFKEIKLNKILKFHKIFEFIILFLYLIFIYII